MVIYKNYFFIFLFLIVPQWGFSYELGKTIILDSTQSYWEIGADNGLRAFPEHSKALKNINELPWEKATSNSLSKGYGTLDGWCYFKTLNPENVEKKLGRVLISNPT